MDANPVSTQNAVIICKNVCQQLHQPGQLVFCLETKADA